MQGGPQADTPDVSSSTAAAEVPVGEASDESSPSTRQDRAHLQDDVKPHTLQATELPPRLVCKPQLP